MIPGLDLEDVEGVQSVHGAQNIFLGVCRSLIYTCHDEAAYMAAVHVGGWCHEVPCKARIKGW
jgi:hypothetical protein